MKFLKILASSIIKLIGFIIILFFGSVLLAFVGMSQYAQISEMMKYDVVLSESQQNLDFRFVPKEISDFHYFQDATSNQWFKPIQIKDDSLKTDYAFIYSIDIQSKSQSGEYKYWKINSVLNKDLIKSHYELEEVSNIDKVSVKSWMFYHSWKFILPSMLLLILSKYFDKLLGSRSMFVEISIILAYLIYWLSILF